jgi:hypothetical protein
MPLLPLQTNLKSLKYGDAGPYIEKDINNPPRYNVLGNEVTARVDDLRRISKLLVDTPGLKWTLHQATLNLAYNEKKGFGRKLLNSLGNTAKVIGSTLAQVPVNGTGTHFVIGFGGNEYLKQGGQRSSWLDRFLKTTAGTGGVNGAKSVLNGKNVILDHRGEEGYRPMIDTQFTDEIEFKDARPIDIAQSYIKQDGSLLARENGKVITDNTGLEGYRTPNEGLDRIDQELKINIDDTYLRQDGRVLLKGAEGTSIDASVPTRLDSESPETARERLTPLADAKEVGRDKKTSSEFTNQDTYDTTAARSRDSKDPFQKSTNKLNPQEAEKGNKTPKIGAASVDNKLEPYLQSGGEVKQGKDAPKAVANPDFNYGKNVGGEYSVANPAILRDFRQKGSGGATDYTTKSIAAKDTARKEKEKAGTAIARNEEMIPFTFTIITPDNFGSGAPTLHFWAFLDSLNDNFNATWNGQKYVGRGESFYNYGGFERKASVGFKVAGGSYKELETYYKKLNKLASSTAPTYDTSGTFMRGSYVRVNIGTYFYNQPVLMNSVGLTWDLATPWEINYELAADVSEVPHVLSVALDMTVIHDFTPTYATEGKEYFGFKR